MKGKILVYILFPICMLPSPIFSQYWDINFPLQFGNVWQYNEVPGFYSDSRVVKDTTMSNGITYTQIKGTLFGGYYRKDGPKVFVFSTSTGVGYGEFLKYDFSLKAGDTIRVIIHGLDTTLITVSSAGTKTFFGTERNYMSFLINNLQSTGDGEETVVDGFG